MSSSFTQSAVSAMRILYPESLADKSFDNTGLLLESVPNTHRKPPLSNRVLLAIDLTTAVATEAIAKDVSLIVAYHPIIFRALKSLTAPDTQQRSLLRLASEGISVYSPHTAVDAAPGGNADWLMDMLLGTFKASNPPTKARAPSPPDSALETTDGARYHFASFPQRTHEIRTFSHQVIEAQRRVIIPSEVSVEGGHAGMGRQCTLDSPTPLDWLLQNLLENLENPSAVRLALASSSSHNTTKISDIRVKTVAVCAGSGGGIVSKADPTADLVVTGEMSHHEVLAMTERGVTVVCLEHSNSERGYLATVMQPKLLEAVSKEYVDAEVIVSEADRDPFSMLVKNTS